MSGTDYNQSSYFQDVKDIALEIREQHKESGSDFDENDAVHESVGGSSWTIYHANARKVLEYSDNDCAIFEELGPQSWTDWSTAFSQSAYFAMARDVYEALSELPEIETCCSCDESYEEGRFDDHECPEDDEQDYCDDCGDEVDGDELHICTDVDKEDLT